MTSHDVIEWATAALVVVSAAATLALTIILILTGPAVPPPCLDPAQTGPACEETQP